MYLLGKVQDPSNQRCSCLFGTDTSVNYENLSLMILEWGPNLKLPCELLTQNARLRGPRWARSFWHAILVYIALTGGSCGSQTLYSVLRASMGNAYVYLKSSATLFCLPRAWTLSALTILKFTLNADNLFALFLFKFGQPGIVMCWLVNNLLWYLV